MTDLHHDAAAYALNALDFNERRAFEAHYPTCDICRAEVVEFRETAAMLAASVPADPPSDLKARVMADIAQTRQVPPLVPDNMVELAERRRLKLNRPVLLAAVAAAVVMVITAVSALGFSRDGVDPRVELLAAPDAVVTELEGDTGTLRVLWSPSRDRAVVIGSDLPDPGAGRTYELWFLRDDGVVAAGLFTPTDGMVSALLDFEDIDGLGWGVTNEPNGGSPQPTGDVLYSGLLPT